MAAMNPAAAANPYRTPAAAVADAGEGTQPVRLFSVSGRVGRARYIAYTLGLNILIGMLAGALSGVHQMAGITVQIVGGIMLLVIAITLTIQRCHDFNTSGWLALLMVVPLVNLIFLLIPGTAGANRFGPPTPPNTVMTLIGAWLLPIVVFGAISAAIVLPAYSDYQKRAAGSVQKR